MPVRSVESSPGHRVLEFRCDCGDYAVVGEGCNIRAAMNTKDVKRAGTWYCGVMPGGRGYCKRAKEKAA